MKDTQCKPKVISIRNFATAEPAGTSPISQERLRIGQQLMEEPRRTFEALHKFKLEIEAELAAGAGIEAGELTFDRELKIVRRRHSGSARILQVSAC
jgi:hypothetical protein